MFNASNGCVSIKEAAQDWPSLSQYLRSGKIDLGNSNALLAYNKAILFRLTGYKIEIPNGQLIPTICLRNTYIQAIKVLIPNARVLVDVGTGSSAILALLAYYAGFTVHATEFLKTSILYAKKNIKKNKADIEIYPSDGKYLTGVIPKSILTTIDVAITYPPFYSTKTVYKMPKSARGFRGIKEELIGGIKSEQFTLCYIADCSVARMKHVTVLCNTKDLAIVASNFMKSKNYDPRIATIKAGTRNRYLLYGSLLEVI